jgi:pimeloyl-ACP methyl ester carboxylesterase
MPLIYLLAIPLGIAALIVLYIVVLRLLNPAYNRADEVHDVHTEDGWIIRLYRYKPHEDDEGEPVLMCHGAFANHHNFDIPEGNCLADYLRASGYDCWLMDFRGDRSSTPPRGVSRNSATVDQYLLGDLPAAVTYIKKVTGFAEVHGLGHSMGGMLLYAYDLTFEDADLASLTTLGSPVGFEPLPHKEMKWLVKWIRRAPWLCKTVQRMIMPWLRIRRVSNAAFPINWDNTPKTVGIRQGYHAVDVLPWRVADSLDTWAAHNDWHMCNGELDVVASLPFLRTPLFAIYAEADRLTNPDYVREFFENIRETDKKMLFLSKSQGHSEDYDHIDLVFGLQATEEVFLPIREWLEAHPAGAAVNAEELLTRTEQETAVPVPRSTTRKTPADMLLEVDEDMEIMSESTENFAALEIVEAIDEPEDDLSATQQRRLGRVMDDIQSALVDVESEGQEKSRRAKPAKQKAPAKKKTSEVKKAAAKKKAAPKKKATAKKKTSTAKKKTSAAKKKASPRKSTASKSSAKKTTAKKKSSTKKKTSAKRKPK